MPSNTPMTVRLLCGLLLFALWPGVLRAALLYGTVSDPSGEALPFANVLVEGSTRGAATNLEGYFELELEPGAYVLIVRYLGYATRRIPLNLGSENQELQVTLQPESLTLSDVVVSGSEDPAVAIMRKAIARRETYRRETPDFSADVYIKGLQQIDEAPVRILGIKIETGDLLDSNRTGIVYLSESFSRLHVQGAGTPGKRTREDMLASKVSGDDQAFSWNEAAPMEVSFYQPRMGMDGLSERQFISPLADDAFFYYRFRLQGTFLDEDQRLINKIEVVPRREHDPVFRGHVYVVEDSWRLYGTELMLTRDAGIEFIDSLALHMTYAPVDSQRWMPVSRHFRFRFGVLGIRGQGYFLGYYSGYELDPSFPRGFFGPEVLSVQRGANEMDSAYWMASRPVPLSPLERADYRAKDVLAERRKSQAYLDSLDRESNQWEFMNLLLGYQRSNTYKKRSWSVESPLSSIGYNTVEGWFLQAGGIWNQELERNRAITLGSRLRYGISNQRLQAEGRLRWLSDATRFQTLELSAGRQVAEYHPNGAISPLVNTAYTIWLEQNYLKLFEQTFAEAAFSRHLFNGLQARLELHWAERRGMTNNADWVWNDVRGRAFTSNDPRDPDNQGLPLATHRISRIQLGLSYQIAQKYSSEPDRRYLLPSRWPRLNLNVQSGLPVLGSELRFTRARASANWELPLGLVGVSQFEVGGGGFLQSDSLTFIDFQHFQGNQTIFLRPGLARFHVLPYFERSTIRPWAELHYEHHFNGFFFNKLPGLRKLRWQLVAGTHALYTADQGWYQELSLGIEHLFKVGRVEGVFGRGEEGENRWGVLVGFGF